MPDLPHVNDSLEVLLSLIALIGALAAFARWLVRTELPRRRQKHAERQAVNEVLLGRPAQPANPITGAPPQPAVPSIGQQMADVKKRVDDIHHEVHPNGGGSMRDDISRIKNRQVADFERFADLRHRLERVESLLADELHTAHDALDHAAEASKVVLTTIHDAIKAQPPEE